MPAPAEASGVNRNLTKPFCFPRERNVRLSPSFVSCGTQIKVENQVPVGISKIMTTSFDDGSYPSSKVWIPPTASAKAVDTSSDFLTSVKEQLRRNYGELLETSLPEELATLIGQLDEAP